MADINSRRKITKKTENLSSVEGKLPPQAIDMEEAVLGAIMLEKDAIINIIDILKPHSFYKESHVHIYGAIQKLFNRSEPIDILTVTEELKKAAQLDAVGGAYYITQLTNRVASAAHVEYHARIIAQKHIQRELIRVSTKTINDAYEESNDVFDLLENAGNSIFNISEVNTKTDFESSGQLIKKTLEEMEKNGNNIDGITGIPSGLSSLDRITAGWQKTDLVIIAARPAMGKTAFVLTAARNAAFNSNKKTAIFSLEMSKTQLMHRLISSEAEINGKQIKSGKLDQNEWGRIHSITGILCKENLFIDDTPGISVFELRAKARRLKEKKGIELLIVDYLQLMTAESSGYGNREQEISFISRSLKGLAKELDIPVIALSQLSRSAETRGNGSKPKLSDLRESGAIEQDADMVGFLYRPSYYDITTDADGRQLEGSEAFLLIEKHRNGPLDDAKFKFIGEYTKFTDWDEINFIKAPTIQPNHDFSEPRKDWETEDIPF